MKTLNNSLDKEIKEYLINLNPQQKKTVLTIIKTFAKEKDDWWDEISKEQQKATIESLSQMKSQKVLSHSDVMKKYKHG